MTKRDCSNRKIRKIIKEITALIKKETKRNIKRGHVETAMGFLISEGAAIYNVNRKISITAIKENLHFIEKAVSDKLDEAEITVRVYEEGKLRIDYVYIIDLLK
jgi:hypothetical protein